ncbi:hypothetical protein M9H77_27088 [Catharanthus roseus]|uniref:Uncharacterized protein n=1 Tax=Catharanthus roseus TaxID=4058 RepID=A0ACC0ADF0_CATRO|nr:hypothetical protein M9H77_27088 [Catharanthus roseus]
MLQFLYESDEYRSSSTIHIRNKRFGKTLNPQLPSPTTFFQFCINSYINSRNALLKGNGTDGESGFTTDDKLDLPLLSPPPLSLPLRGDLPLPRGLGLEPESELLPYPEPEPLDLPIFLCVMEMYSQ